MLLLVSTLLLISGTQSQDAYHYPRPQNTNPASVPQPVNKFIVQTLGPQGRTYELSAHKSPAGYVSHETFAVNTNQLQQPRQQHQLQQPQHVPNSANNNPLLVSARPQSVSMALVPPPPPPPPATAVAVQPAVYYTQPQVLTTVQTQPAPAYFVQQQVQLLPRPQPQPFSNPLPYATITLPNGQRLQEAGHGSGISQNPNPIRAGDYNSQSPSASLDSYAYKQSVAGETRSYQRYVKNCEPNGQCQQLQLQPGQIDAGHQKVLEETRAKTQIEKGNCQPDTYVPPGAQRNEQGLLRPRDRRIQYRRVEYRPQVQLVVYPYN